MHALCAAAAAVALVLYGARLYFRVPVKEYYRASQRSFHIPGCGDGFIPQGIFYDENANRFWVGGYQKDSTASAIYIVAPEARKPAKTVRMALPDGSDYTGHAGGIALHGGYVYVADGDKRRLLVFSYDSIIGASDGGRVEALGFFDTAVSDSDYIGPAFVTIDGNRLVTGEFYRDPEYQTPESHKGMTAAGDFLNAVAVVYRLDGQAEYGIDPVPVAAYRLPDLAQGMCFDGNDIYVSASWGAAHSHIYRYSRDRMQYQGSISLLGEELPLYALDSAALAADKKIPPMSEEIVIVDGRMHTMCEAASNKYIFGKFTSAQWCYATSLDFFR